MERLLREVDPNDVAELMAIAQESERRALNNKLKLETAKPFDYTRPAGTDNIGPYEWQVYFHNLGRDYVERCLMAANQVGKTRTGGIETAIHATGMYPDWWEGARWNHGIDVWVGSETNQSSRDIVQKELLGSPIGTGGWIPGNKIIKLNYRQCGIPNVVESVVVNHKSGQPSRIGFMTYEQGRRKWQGVRMHFLWMDEEPPHDVFTEALTRLIANRGKMILTFTPLEGVGGTVEHFVDGGQSIKLVTATWDDAPHLDEERKQQLINSYPEHERATRTEGVPMVGTGRVYPIDERYIRCDPFEIPSHWVRICGIDFGFDHPFAAVWIAWNRDADVIYVYDVHSAKGETLAYHAEAIRRRGDWIPVAWPHDGQQREKSSGIHLADQLRYDHGIESLLDISARYDDESGGGQDTEPVVMEINGRMRSGNFKVFSNCHEWFREARMYHRKDGRIVKKNDDVMSGTHYAVMMKRFAISEGELNQNFSRTATYNPLGS